MSKHIKTREQSHRQDGFTLLEMAIVLAVLATLASGFYQWKQSVLREGMVQRTVDGIVRLEEALYGYKMNPEHGYNWPDTILELVPYLPNFVDGGRNGVGQAYRLIPPAAPVLLTDGIQIETDLLTAERAQQVARLFPLNGRVDGTRVLIGVPVPGHEVARDAVLSRDGEKAMLGNLNMDGHSVAGVDQLTANRIESPLIVDSDDSVFQLDPSSSSNFNQMTVASIETREATLGKARLAGNFTIGARCTTKEVGTTSTGQLLECIGGIWSYPQASTIRVLTERIEQLEADNQTGTPEQPQFQIVSREFTGSYNQTFPPIPGYLATQCRVISYTELSAQAPRPYCYLQTIYGSCSKSCDAAVRSISPTLLRVSYAQTVYASRGGSCKGNCWCETSVNVLSGRIRYVMQCSRAGAPGSG